MFQRLFLSLLPQFHLGLLVVGMLTLTTTAAAQEEEPLSPEAMALIERYSSIEWQPGPTVGKIGTLAQIDVPEGYQFTEAAGAQALLELYGNPPDPGILAALVPTSEDEDWTLIFQFDNIGYVKDEDKDSLDAGAILENFQAGLSSMNAQRRAAGVEECSSIGWMEEPFYDSQTNNLTWALRLGFDSGDTVNYDIRLLGRRGVMEATLLADPETYGDSVPAVKQLLAGYSFVPGNTYAEWTTGDKVAAVGLTGLVAGGATAIAAKTGVLAKLGVLLAKGGKAIIIGMLVLGAGVLSFLRRLFGGREPSTE